MLHITAVLYNIYKIHSFQERVCDSPSLSPSADEANTPLQSQPSSSASSSPERLGIKYYLQERSAACLSYSHCPIYKYLSTLISQSNKFIQINVLNFKSHIIILCLKDEKFSCNFSGF